MQLCAKNICFDFEIIAEFNFGFLKKVSVMINLSNFHRHSFSTTAKHLMTSQTKVLRHKSSIVFYDLETTGFGQAQIVGLGAVDTIGNTFHRYIVPTCSISPGASKVHGITKVKNELFIHGQKIQNPVHPNEGLGDFIGNVQL